VGNCCYVAVCSAELGASAPTEGGEGRGHIVTAARLQLVNYGLVCFEFELNSRLFSRNKSIILTSGGL